MNKNNNKLQRIEALFNEVVELPVEQRSAWLIKACDGDDELLQSVLALLRFEGAGDQLENLVQVAAHKVISDEQQQPGARIGPFVVSGELGRGGMGAVYLAHRDDQEFQQTVAIKLIDGTHLSKSILNRFRAERQILARLEHPYIGRLLDGGTTDAGVPYLVMEYVEGMPIDSFCNQQQLTINQRLRLFVKVCRAVQYAHQKLIVHRDLKPSNILITAEGEPKLLDFGIAKMLDPDDNQISGGLTRDGSRMFTPFYSSPEQIRGEPVSTASDVYSLGVILYELLTAHRPYPQTNTDGYELEKAILESDPQRPSSLVNKTGVENSPLVAGHFDCGPMDWCGGLNPGQLKRQLAGDLDNILMMALRKEADRRYVSVADFASDVERYLARLPVQARATSWIYRSSKFFSRHRISSVLVTVLLVSIIGFSITTWLQSQEIAKERDAATTERSRAEAISDFLVNMFATNDPDKSQGRDITVREVLDEASKSLGQKDHALSNSPETEATIRRNIGVIYMDLGLYDQAEENLQKALQLERNESPVNPQELFLTLYETGALALNQFNKEACEHLTLEARQIGQSMYSPDDPKMTAVLNNLASCYQIQGNLPEAKDLFAQLLEINARTLGPSHGNTITALSNLASVNYWLENFEQAGVGFKECLNRATQQFGELNSRALFCLSNYASLMETTGEYEKAEPLIGKHITLATRVYGQSHPVVMRSMHNLADTLRGLGRYEESEVLFLKTLLMRREILGDGNLETLQTEFKLGRLYRLMGREQEGLLLVQEAIDKLTANYGSDHPTTKTALEELKNFTNPTDTSFPQ